MTKTAEETAIADLLDRFARALHDRDPEAAIAPLTADAVTFDFAPPLRNDAAATHDPAPLREWFDTWTSPIVSESHDRTIVVGDGVAYAYGLQHMTGKRTDGEQVDMWFRATACFRKEGGAWKISHMHNSVPFAMDGTAKALRDLKP